MKVLLIKDVYKLGHAGDVKKVADGFGRNFLIPQGLAVLATAGALSTIDRIKAKAAVSRAALNQEMSGLAEQLAGVELSFVTKAGETGKLYGSITSQMVVDALNQKLGTKIERHQIESEPIRNLGEHHVTVRLTIDLNPKITVIVVREGDDSLKETPKAKTKTAKVEEQISETTVEPVVEPVAEEIAEPVVEKIVEPVTEEVAEPVVEKIVEPVVDEVAEPVVETIIEETKSDEAIEPAAE